ncbi:MAG: ureidoglycolate lyase [Pseudoruegeria sp.]
MTVIATQPLTPAAFAPFGDVQEATGIPVKIINQGFCERFHDRARMDFGQGGQAGISLFQAKPRKLPYTVDLLERHPDGSQAFVPMSMDPFLVIVANDINGTPGQPLAFMTTPGQGINFHRNIWHGVLTPLSAPGLFAVIDRIGNTPNLEEYKLEAPYTIEK